MREPGSSDVLAFGFVFRGSLRMRAGSRALLGCVLLVSSVSAVAVTRHAGECVDGVVEGYACSNVDLLAHMDLVALGTTASGNGNDMWGWTDPDTGKEYALVGLNNGTAFVDISRSGKSGPAGQFGRRTASIRPGATSRPTATTR